MVIHDDRQLLEVQETADEMAELHDPVFCLDESLNTLSMVAQVEGLSAADAAEHGEKLFISALLGAGISNKLDIVEHLKTELCVDDADLAVHFYGRTHT